VAIQYVNSVDSSGTFGDTSVKKFYSEGSKIHKHLRRLAKVPNLSRVKFLLPLIQFLFYLFYIIFILFIFIFIIKINTLPS